MKIELWGTTGDGLLTGKIIFDSSRNSGDKDKPEEKTDDADSECRQLE